MKLTKEHVEKAANSNLMVYDEYDKDGVFTNRLYLLLINFFYEFYKTYPSQLFLPSLAVESNVPELGEINIIIDKDLAYWGSLNFYYRYELKCSLPSTKTELCLISDGENYLLGSF